MSWKPSPISRGYSLQAADLVPTSLQVLESIANASEGYQKAAKSAIDWHGRGKKVRNKIAAARKRMSHKAKKALKKVKQAEKQFQRQVKTLTRKAHGFLKAMNSKRLVRRVLIANAWLWAIECKCCLLYNSCKMTKGIVTMYLGGITPCNIGAGCFEALASKCMPDLLYLETQNL